MLLAVTILQGACLVYLLTVQYLKIKQCFKYYTKLVVDVIAKIIQLL